MEGEVWASGWQGVKRQDPAPYIYATLENQTVCSGYINPLTSSSLLIWEGLDLSRLRGERQSSCNLWTARTGGVAGLKETEASSSMFWKGMFKVGPLELVVQSS